MYDYVKQSLKQLWASREIPSFKSIIYDLQGNSVDQYICAIYKQLIK